MAKTYTIGGTSVVNGISTFRVANGKLNLRRNMLNYFKHENINLIELPRPMTKMEAVAYLITKGYTGVVPTRAADKTHKNAMQLEAEKLAAKRMRDAARKRERRAAA